MNVAALQGRLATLHGLMEAMGMDQKGKVVKSELSFMSAFRKLN